MNANRLTNGREHLIAAAEQRECVAAEDEAVAAHERAVGLDLSRPGMSAGDFRAKTARTCARTLRLQAETGKPHCMCHERPTSECPTYVSARRI